MSWSRQLLNMSFDDDMLIISVKALYNATMIKQHHDTILKEWITQNIHKEMAQICNKYDDKEWLKRGQHQYCIYYACHIIGTLCNISDDACIDIVDEPHFISTLISLWKGDNTWFESRVAARTISIILANTPRIQYKFVHNIYNINIAELAIKQYSSCVKYVIKRCMMAPNKIDVYIQNLILQICGKRVDCKVFDFLTKKAFDFAQDWMHYNGTIICALSISLNDDVVKLFESINVKLWNKACSMDLCWRWYHSSIVEDDVTPSKKHHDHDTAIHALIHLTKYRKYAQLISKSDVIIKALIIKLRSRRCIHLRYDILIFNLLRFGKIQQKYYYDLCVSLVLLLEIDRNYNYIPFQFLLNCNSQKSLFDIIIDSLKFIFDIPLKFEFVKNKLRKKFTCLSCKRLLSNPYKMKCNHFYCHFCIENNIKTKTGKCLLNKCENKYPFRGEDEKFNMKISNEINKAEIKIIINNGNNIFIGRMSECWLFIKNNLNRNNFKNDLKFNNLFEYFCDFMIKESVIKNTSNLKSLRISARNIRIDGNKLFKNGEYLKAIKCYNESLKICPNKYKEDRSVYYSNLALTYIKLNKYFEAYKVSLSGLTCNALIISEIYHNLIEIKLSNVLSKCYSVLNINQLFTQNIIDNDFYLNQVQAIIINNFTRYFQCQYQAQKYNYSKLKKIDNDIIDGHILELKTNDTYYQSLQHKIMNCSQKLWFRKYHSSKYRKKYTEFKKNKKAAKKEIFKFILFVLSNKDKFWIFDNENNVKNDEWIRIDQLLEVINDEFDLEPILKKISEIQQDFLINGYIKNGENGISVIPKDISKLIQKLIFLKPKYNLYHIDDGICGIRRMLNKSKHLTLSDDNDDGVYCVKSSFSQYHLTEIELTDNDSGLDEFCCNVDNDQL